MAVERVLWLMAMVAGRSVAHAPVEPAPIDLQWQAPADCPNEEQVRERLTALLQDSGSEARLPVVLRMQVEAIDGGFSLQVDRVAPDGQTTGRRIEAGRCDELTEAGVLVAALAIDPGLRLPETQTEAPSERAAVPAAPKSATSIQGGVESSASPVDGKPAKRGPPGRNEGARPESSNSDAGSSTPPTPPSVPITGFVGLDFGLGLGRLARGPSALGRLAGGVERARLRALLRVSGFGPSRGRAPDGPAGGLFAAGTVGVAGCGQFRIAPRWALLGCLGSDIGLAAGQGRDTRNTRTQRGLWWGLEAELGAEFWVRPRLAVALRGDGGVVLAVPRFVIDGQGAACCVRWAAGIRGGVAMRLGPKTPR